MTTSSSDQDTQSPADLYRDTVFLPRTSFPMRGGLPKQEPQWLKKWEETGLDARLKQQAEGRPVFTLHDGPRMPMATCTLAMP